MSGIHEAIDPVAPMSQIASDPMPCCHTGAHRRAAKRVLLSRDSNTGPGNGPAAALDD
jgi:hypothetical protein